MTFPLFVVSPPSRAALLVAFLSLVIVSTPSARDQGRLHAQVGLFVDLAPDDSIAAVRAAAPDTLEVVIVSGRGVARTARAPAAPAVLTRLIAAARSADVGSAATASYADAVESPKPRARIREDYMGGQMAATIAVYGVGLVGALQLEGQAMILAPSFAVAAGLAAHSIYSLGNPITESQALGMNYFSSAAILSSYALSYAALGWNNDAFRIGAGASLLAYPLSLWPGHAYGSSFRNEPWELSKKVVGSGAAAALGALLPWVYFEDADADLYVRTGALQLLAFGVAGNFAADLYRPGERISEGTATGIFSHTALGALAGAALHATVDSKDSRVDMGILLGSATAGFAEGLWFFRDRNDDADRGNYASFGMGGGLLLTGAVALAGTMDAAPALWLMTAGGLTGYAIVYRAMDAHAGSAMPARTRTSRGVHSSFQPLPVPEALRITDARTGRETIAMRYRVPGLVVRF
jgi:hypothetical protein